MRKLNFHFFVPRSFTAAVIASSPIHYADDNAITEVKPKQTPSPAIGVEWKNTSANYGERRRRQLVDVEMKIDGGELLKICEVEGGENLLDTQQATHETRIKQFK